MALSTLYRPENVLTKERFWENGFVKTGGVICFFRGMKPFHGSTWRVYAEEVENVFKT